MTRPLRWITEPHLGMYVHVLAFMLPGEWRDVTAPGQKWGYLVGVGRSNVPTTEMQYVPEADDDDYFTAEAAQQVALHYGKRVIDVMVESD
ncbi:hypothetical protein [Cupriavidus campinensis]|uniref:hypothetical protein n=1 Tax=Cupriavidus campinensis TaxID=151783 RepID=UPI0011EE324D|nr:hypothetical protein [Cupriavidus campinensis]